MKIPIRRKLDYTVPQPMAMKEWSYGYMIGNVRAGDDRAYAVILTEHDEFEYIMLYGIVHEPRFPFSTEPTDKEVNK